jgi:hypothetical protein
MLSNDKHAYMCRYDADDDRCESQKKKKKKKKNISCTYQVVSDSVQPDEASSCIQRCTKTCLCIPLLFMLDMLIFYTQINT